jgi:hypothetical protein
MFATPRAGRLSVSPAPVVGIDGRQGFFEGALIRNRERAASEVPIACPGAYASQTAGHISPNRRRVLAIASYEVSGTGGAWHVKHDGEPIGNYPSKEAAFEAAVAAAREQIREGYEAHILVPGRRIEP